MTLIEYRLEVARLATAVLVRYFDKFTVEWDAPTAEQNIPIREFGTCAAYARGILSAAGIKEPKEQEVTL